MTAALLAVPTATGRGWKFGLGWSAAAQVAGTLVKLGSTLVLTRLLAPDAYALLGTAMVVMTTLEWLSDLGVLPALVRDPRGADPTRLLVGWWVNLGRGAALSMAAAAAAVPLAHFYRQPELIPVMLALAARPALLALRSPGVPLLRRRLDFRGLFVDEIGQAVVGTGVSIAAAAVLTGTTGGVWALVAGTMAGAAAGVLLSYVLCPLRPRWVWDAEVARHFSVFGRQVLVNTLAMAACLNLDRLLGPLVLPLDAVGWYVVGWNLAAAAEAVVTRGTDVYFTLVVRHLPEDRESWHAATTRRLAWRYGPALAVAAAVAPAGVRVLYDPRYHPAGLVLAVLVGRLIVRTAGQLDFQLLLANGRVRPATAGYLAGAVVQAATVVPLASTFGEVGLAASVLLSTVAVSAVPALLCPALGGRALSRLALGGGWAAAGLAGATAVARLTT